MYKRFPVASGSMTRTKVRNLEVDPRACVLVMASASSTEIDDGWEEAAGTLGFGCRGEELDKPAVAPYLTVEDTYAACVASGPVASAISVRQAVCRGSIAELPEH